MVGIALRRNNVPIDPNSAEVVNLVIQGFFNNSSQQLLCYSITCNVDESQWVFRQRECHLATVRVWNKGGWFGYVGREKANEPLLNDVEKCAEIFANDFLSANPKQ
jgi:hypothetical protein